MSLPSAAAAAPALASRRRSAAAFLALAALDFAAAGPALRADLPEGDGAPLPGTERLQMEGDIASHLVAGVDRFLLRELHDSVHLRAVHWKRDRTSPEAYVRSVAPNRERLGQILGLRDGRVDFDGFTLEGTTRRPAKVGSAEAFDVFAVRWPAFRDVEGEGLLLVPKGGLAPVADVVAVPDCGRTPEQIAGIAGGVPFAEQYARLLAEAGCRVLVPTLVDRQERMSKLTHREYLYRSAFELGRTLIGYEVQKVLAAVDQFERDGGAEARVGVFGWGEGGLIALYSAALDTRVDAAGVSGYFGPRERLWTEPLDRNLFGLLEQLGDAELATLVAPRRLVVEAARAPEAVIPGGRGAPAEVVTPDLAKAKAEAVRAQGWVAGLDAGDAPWFTFVPSGADGRGPHGTEAALRAFLGALAPGEEGRVPAALGLPAKAVGAGVDAAARMRRQVDQIDRHNQWLLRESAYVRKQFYQPDTTSLAAFEKSNERFRKIFYDEVIGRFDRELLPPEPRTRMAYRDEAGGWTGYEVVLEVFPDVIAYGVLVLPDGLEEADQRPVVVCQHGLEGRPQSTLGEKDHRYYKAFATELAKRGFITFAPQNLYLFGDRFRTLQRKANPLKKTLFSVIVPQHQQIVDWLQDLPFVDPGRIAFYGLSYGGKTAMRVPPLVEDYCLSICSADFNEWVDKNASTRNPHSYINTGEYEIFEWDLGSTFNYAEMAGLIAPRPFMVERGHYDGVASDETVGYEFAKVRFLYQGKLKIGERCQIEWFDGPHSINGRGTFEFLHRHLNWPAPTE